MRPMGCTLSGGLIFFSPVINRVLRLSIPFLLGIGMLLVLYSIYDYNTFLELASLVILYFIPPAGKESLIPAAIALGIPWYTICAIFTFIDIISCLFLLWNFEILLSIPFIGPRLIRLMHKGREFLSKHEWLERLYLVGLAVFVFFPLQGTGAVSGTVIGKMAGMPPIEIFCAISIGSTLHSLIIGLSAYALNKYLGLNLWYMVVFILGVIVLISVVTYLWYRNTETECTSNDQS